jgi:NTE family protein
MKTAFVLSGGGAKGAFQVGALNYLMNIKQIKPDIITGISTGALQALAIAQDELKLLDDVWLGIKSYKDIYTKSFFQYIRVILGQSAGLYKFDGLETIVSKIFDKSKLMASDAELYIGTVDLQDGTLDYIEKRRLQKEDVVASCTIPIFFPPVANNGRQYVDGGVRDIVPLKIAIEMGADQIYVLLCSPETLAPIEHELTNIVEVGTRTSEILINEIYRNDIAHAKQVNMWLKNMGGFNGYRNIDIKVIEPEYDVCNILDFKPDIIRRAIDYGYDQARKMTQ